MGKSGWVGRQLTSAPHVKMCTTETANASKVGGGGAYLLEVIDMVSLMDAASVGSLYRNMFVLPSTTTQP